MMDFDEFFEKEFKTEYIADGDWTKVNYCGQEFGMSYSPEYEIENFRDIAGCTWDYQQDRITELEKLVEDQATEIQRVKTLNSKIMHSIGFAIYYMKKSGYQNMDNSQPERKMYNEFKEIMERE